MFLSEMGDKTQLLALSLAIRHGQKSGSRWIILTGICIATLLNHTMVAYLGEWISEFFEPPILAILLSCLFVAFGIWTLKPHASEHPTFNRYGLFGSTLILFFLSEMGDKTQLVTMALSAKYQSPLLISLGATAGTLTSDGLAIFLGKRLSDKLNMKWIRFATAILFFCFAFVSAYKGITE